jgi:hypothetical protein
MWLKDSESERHALGVIDTKDDAHPFAPPLSRSIVSPSTRVRQSLVP